MVFQPEGKHWQYGPISASPRRLQMTGMASMGGVPYAQTASRPDQLKDLYYASVARGGRPDATAFWDSHVAKNNLKQVGSLAQYGSRSPRQPFSPRHIKMSAREGPGKTMTESMYGMTYKAFKGAQWKALTLLTAFLYPGITFGIFFVLNLFIWGQASSGAVPFGTMFALLCIWFLISFPLVWVGVWLGYRRVLKDPPVKTNMVPRVIPSQAWYLNQLFTMLIGGVLPFGAVFIELYFIMSSVWLQRFYYVFGFLALVLLILLITCGEMAIVLCYFQLCNENYLWQWRSFLNTGSAGLFLFGYSIVYFSSTLEIMGVISTMLYFSYMFVGSLLFSLVTGTVGFVCSWWFVLQIYGAVKVD